ncbi:M15 family metallopeptidase [Cognatilysobacter terrigena]|uniref:M15 family metallopeptidase n=1 Tax=Cognatilysobacter terrigena TaxID=2488749 RepID=UPI00105F6CBD|nr:M15 family metallopeptidase [Lysobacter terrigena]
MRPRPTTLINTPDVELWPAHLLRARSNADARTLARATHVLRRKRDGRFLAASTSAGIEPLTWNWHSEGGVDQALRALDAPPRGSHIDDHDLPLARIEHRLHALGLDADAYSERTGLALVAEPAALRFAGFDRYRRPLWLRPAAARAWRTMHDAALREGIVLEAISGYRSHDYQLGIFERKLARGQTVDEILTVNAAPGYSEHHAGRALDIASPGEPPAEESFELTPAFEWLTANAGAYGFVMSYPRDNPHGIVYEPWHWCHRG